MNQQIFNQTEKEYGCGYFKVCIDKVCDCKRIKQGYDGRIYRYMKTNFNKYFKSQDQLTNSYNFEETM